MHKRRRQHFTNSGCVMRTVALALAAGLPRVGAAWRSPVPARTFYPVGKLDIEGEGFAVRLGAVEHRGHQLEKLVDRCFVDQVHRIGDAEPDLRRALAQLQRAGEIHIPPRP